MSNTTEVIRRDQHFILGSIGMSTFLIVLVGLAGGMTLFVIRASRPSPPQISGKVPLASIAEEENRAKQDPSSALLVVQYRSDMTPAFCWKHQPIRMAMGFGSEALRLYPQEFSGDSYLVITSFVNVAVIHDLTNHPNDLGAAAQLLGIQLSKCLGGKYNASASK